MKNKYLTNAYDFEIRRLLNLLPYLVFIPYVKVKCPN